MIDGIQLDDSTTFRTWAEQILPWLNPAMHDVAEGIGGDVAGLLARQDRYSGYAGRLVEIFAEAQCYYKSALAEAMGKLLDKKIAPSLVARIAEKDCKNEIKVYEAVHRLNSTLSDQLIAIAARLKYEGNLIPKVPF